MFAAKIEISIMSQFLTAYNIIDRIEYFKGFISKIEEKLKNDSFINKAPESIIKREKQKLEDSKSQLLLLQEKMRTITNE